MSILFPEGGPNNFILSLKIILISISVLSAAFALKFSVPALTDFVVSEVPSLYNGVLAWLKPPYLYLVINCIIITLVASSKLQSKLDGPQLQTTPVPVYHHQPQPVPLVDDIVTLKDEVVEAAAVSRPEVFYFNNNSNNSYGDKVLEEDDNKEIVKVNAVAAPVVEMNGYGDESVISNSPWSTTSPVSRTDSLEFSLISNEKPPVSARFGHRRPIKAIPEGGKAALGVSKPKTKDTLESTWKTITEGRAMPLARHLRKSDTWETYGGRNHHHHNQAPQTHKMIKSETFSDRSKTNGNGIGNNNNSLLSASPGSGKLKREPSLSQDELNRRVEAFIKKFNDEMRLQRQESLNQYMEMINRGAH